MVYKCLSSSWWIFLQPPVTSSHLGLNIPSRVPFWHPQSMFCPWSERPEFHSRTACVCVLSVHSATCRDTYGLPDSSYTRKGPEETRALCTAEYSDISPLTGGNVAFSTLEGRPSAYNFDASPELQVSAWFLKPVYIYCDMTPERRKCAVGEALQRRPLLDNGSLGTFPRQRIGL
jgi:hypothetical protein